MERDPCEGSSPLARGLRRVVAYRGDVRRIIPARAGFTRSCAPPCRPGRDHPRSRGVYVSTSSAAGSVRGSSPLARGLPTMTPMVWSRRRIIPARAGFTRGGRRRRGSPRDHPRSRGVYCPFRGERATRTGSSPLARGLHGDVSLRHVTRGIIPARAGFTVPFAHLGTLVPDHPRSRGVYSRGNRTGASYVGSSPLARGLLRYRTDGAADWGIIPARAGFTTYFLVIPATLWGSSPLARGLHDGHGHQPVGGGIIPARAGFTGRGTAANPPVSDHPRSRGVYN